MAWAATERIFMKFDILKNLLRKFKFYYNMAGKYNTLHEDLCTFMIVPRLILRRMRNGLDKFVRQNQYKYVTF
jgi:hypothetical protein